MVRWRRLEKYSSKSIHPSLAFFQAWVYQLVAPIVAMKESISQSSRNANVLFAVVLLLFVFFLLSQLAEQTKFSSGKSLFAQPRFWPGASLLGMLVFGAGHLIHCALKKSSGTSALLELLQWLRALEYFAWFMLYVVLVPQLGYLPTTILFALVLTIRQGFYGRKMLLIAVAVGLSIVLVFKTLLAVKIPGGAVYEYLPAAVRNFMMINF